MQHVVCRVDGLLATDKDAVTACCWSPQNELFTCSDDKTIARWSMDGEPKGTVCKLDSFATDMSWPPAVGQRASDSFAVSCSDGECDGADVARV